ncbi:MAG: twin-arginine translocase TatA/TatE family subunit [Planctomycetota bacterium]
MTTSFENFPATLGIFAGGIGGWEWAILAFLGLLIFGKRLPEVGKSLGRGIVEFKKGLAGVDDDIAEQKREQDQAKLDAQSTGAPQNVEAPQAERAPQSDPPPAAS